MSGKPRRRALVAELDARTAAMFAEENQPATHLDYVCRWVESGQTVNAMVAELVPAVQRRWAESEGTGGADLAPVTRGSFMSYLNATFGEEETDIRLARARRACAHVLNEESL